MNKDIQIIQTMIGKKDKGKKSHTLINTETHFALRTNHVLNILNKINNTL